MHPGFRSLRLASLMALVAAFSSGCGDSAPTAPNGVTMADLVGSWKASSALFTDKANSSQQFDIVAQGGELRVTVLQSGGARSWLDLGSFSDEWDSQLTLNGDQLTSTPVEAARPTRRYTVALSGGQLTLTSDDASFDFTLSGAAGVPAMEVVVLVRN